MKIAGNFQPRRLFVMRLLSRNYRFVVLTCLSLACTDSEHSARNAVVNIQIRHPRPGDPLPQSGWDYVSGSVGNARANVTVNGVQAHVISNGAFIVYLRAPNGSGPRYHVVGTLGRDTATVMVPVSAGLDSSRFRESARNALARRAVGDSINPFIANRGSVGQILAGPGSGEFQIPGRSAPDGFYDWNLIPGTRGVIVDSSENQVLLSFTEGAFAWIDRKMVGNTRRASGFPSATLSSITSRIVPEGIELSVRLSSPVAYRVIEADSSLTLVLFAARAKLLPAAATMNADRWISISRIENTSPRQLDITLKRKGPAYGYQVAWRENKLVLTVRRPPIINDSTPLKDLRIAVDAGHPPGGATGPTGLTEKSVTLAIAKLVARLLEQHGAHVVLTRRTDDSVSLDERVAVAMKANVHAFISIHTDAVPNGADPALHRGTAVFSFYPHSDPLAVATQWHLTRELRVNDRGVQRGNFLVLRSSWFPAVLCEGATITIPEEELALRTDAFKEAYARAIVEALTDYFIALDQHTRAAIGRQPSP